LIVNYKPIKKSGFGHPKPDFAYYLSCTVLAPT
jgi:hypothetical protein